MGAQIQTDFFDEKGGCVVFGWNDIEYRTSGDNEDLSIHVEPSAAIEVF